MVTYHVTYNVTYPVAYYVTYHMTYPVAYYVTYHMTYQVTHLQQILSKSVNIFEFLSFSLQLSYTESFSDLKVQFSKMSPNSFLTHVQM
jgi:hypothetical protein